MPRILIRDGQNETVAEFPMPEDWKQKPAPDILHRAGKHWRMCGRQDGVISYWPSTCVELPEGVEVKELVKGT